VESAVGQLVDAQLPRGAWVALSDGEEEEFENSVRGTAEEYRSPLASGLGNVELHATGQSRSVASFGVAASQPTCREPIRLKALDHRLDGGAGRIAGVGQVFRERQLIDVDLEGRSRRLFGHLPLAVGGQVAEMLVELLGRQARCSGAVQDGVG
jgi:hypothetical protein